MENIETTITFHEEANVVLEWTGLIDVIGQITKTTCLGIHDPDEDEYHVFIGTGADDDSIKDFFKSLLSTPGSDMTGLVRAYRERDGEARVDMDIIKLNHI